MCRSLREYAFTLPLYSELTDLMQDEVVRCVRLSLER